MKRLLGSLGLYTLLGFVPMATSLIMVPLYLGYLSVDEYGLIALVNVSQVFFVLGVSLNVDAAFARFYFDEEESASHIGKLLATCVLLVVVSSLAWAAGLATLGASVWELALPTLPFHPFAWLVLLTAAGQTLQSVLFLYFRNREEPVYALLTSLAPFLLATAFTFAAVGPLHLGAVGAVAGRAVGTAAGVLPVALFIMRGRAGAPSATLLKSLLAYSAPLLAYTILNNLLFQGDRILVERWFGLETLGRYALAAVVIAPLDVISNAAGQAITPTIYRGLSTGDGATVRRFAEGAYDSLSAGLTVLIVLAIWAFAPLLAFAGREEYAAGAIFVPVLALSQLFRVRYVCSSIPLFYFKRTAWLPFVTAASIGLGLATAALATRYFGLIGIPAAVLAWKWSQDVLARVLVWRSGLPAMRMRRSWRLIAALGAYVVALHLGGFTGRPDDAWVWWGGMVVIGVCLHTAWRSLSELRSAAAASSGVPA